MRIKETDKLCEELAANGYHEYKPHNNADKFFQRRIRAGSKTLYFINVYYYDFTKYNNAYHVGYSATAHFYRSGLVLENGEPVMQSFNVDFHPEDGDGVKQIEAFYEDIYKSLGCVPDIYNND